jgi:hypothetical protein
MFPPRPLFLNAPEEKQYTAMIHRITPVYMSDVLVCPAYN